MGGSWTARDPYLSGIVQRTARRSGGAVWQGRLDDLARFYARSRGLPLAAADRLLTYAFAAEVVDEVTLLPVRAELDRLVLERLGGL